MPFILTLFNAPAYLIWPSTRQGILALILMVAALVFINWRWRFYQREMKEQQWFLFGILLTLAPLLALFIGFRLPDWGSIPLPGRTLEPTGGAIMILAALPVVAAGWVLGPISASVVGMVSGICLAYWDTYSPFTVIEFAT